MKGYSRFEDHWSQLTYLAFMETVPDNPKAHVLPAACDVVLTWPLGGLRSVLGEFHLVEILCGRRSDFKKIKLQFNNKKESIKKKTKYVEIGQYISLLFFPVI